MCLSLTVDLTEVFDRKQLIGVQRHGVPILEVDPQVHHLVEGLLQPAVELGPGSRSSAAPQLDGVRQRVYFGRQRLDAALEADGYWSLAG